jgi:hypothetical protein
MVLERENGSGESTWTQKIPDLGTKQTWRLGEMYLQQRLTNSISTSFNDCAWRNRREMEGAHTGVEVDRKRRAAEER